MLPIRNRGHAPLLAPTRADGGRHGIGRAGGTKQTKNQQDETAYPQTAGPHVPSPSVESSSRSQAGKFGERSDRRWIKRIFEGAHIDGRDGNCWKLPRLFCACAQGHWYEARLASRPQVAERWPRSGLLPLGSQPAAPLQPPRHRIEIGRLAAHSRDVQPVHSRLAHLLRQLLPNEIASDLQSINRSN